MVHYSPHFSAMLHKCINKVINVNHDLANEQKDLQVAQYQIDR